MYRNLKIRISVIWLTACILICGITSYAAFNTISVSLVRQAKSNWCWAASLEMSARSLGYRTYDQWDIVKKVNGTASNPYPDVSGTSTDYSAGMKYATNNNYNATRVKGTLTLSAMDNYMSRDIPIIICLGRYNTSGTRTSGHAVVVYSVDKTSGKFMVRDPGSDTAITYKYSTITDTSASRHWDYTVKIAYIYGSSKKEIDTEFNDLLPVDYS